MFRKMSVVLGFALSLAGCAADGAHVGLTVSDTDENTRFTDADGREVEPPVAAAPAHRPRLNSRRPTLMVVRVESLEVGSTGYAIEDVAVDQRSAFHARVTAKNVIDSEGFADAPSNGKPSTVAQLRKRAVDRGAALLLIYEHKTPLKESGSLIYKVEFDSKARGMLYNTATGRMVCKLSGEAHGTLGGLTPLQMAVHPQVEKQTKRMAVEKLADALSDTLIARPDLASEVALK